METPPNTAAPADQKARFLAAEQQRRVCRAWHRTGEVKVLLSGVRRAEGSRRRARASPRGGVSEVGAWPLAVEPESGLDHRPVRPVLPAVGSTSFGERIGRPTQSTEPPCT
jgi:hypothetical protein